MIQPLKANQSETALRFPRGEPPQLQRPPPCQADLDLVALLPPQSHGEDSRDPEEKEAAGVGLEAADQAGLSALSGHSALV